MNKKEKPLKKIFKNLRLFWKRFWYIVWEDESFFGWVVSLLFAFVIIKFVFFPSLSFMLGTKMPLVVVESNSMHHPGNFILNYFGSERFFEEWWEIAGNWYIENGIEFSEAKKWPLKNGLEIGDIIIVVKAKNIQIGDIIIFEANQRYPVIHRVVDIYEVNNRTVYSTKGDNNPGQLFVETRIPEDAVIGRAIFRIPVIGWVKLIFVKATQFIIGK
ncbi:MAG: signal peptidase I [Candidatus Pacearchaeota archaeon]